ALRSSNRDWSKGTRHPGLDDRVGTVWGCAACRSWIHLPFLDVTEVNPATSIGFGYADPSAGIQRLFALLRLCVAKALLRSASHYCDSFAVKAPERYLALMQGKLIIGAFL